jgi:hypothetical protein
MDAAAAACIALAAIGTDTLLMAADHALRRELNRRIREDLIALGIVNDGPAVRIADGIPDYGDFGQAFPPWRRPARNAILQSPMPEIPPPPETLQRVIDRDADWEAAD